MTLESAPPLAAVDRLVESVSFPGGLPVHALFHSVKSVDFHVHSAFELLLVLSGRIVVHTDQGESLMSPGDLTLLHSGQLHATHDVDDDNLLLALYVDPAVAQKDPYFLRRRFDIAALAQAGDGAERLVRMRALIARTVLELRMKRSAWQMEVEALVLGLLTLLVREVPNQLVAENAGVLLPDETRILSHRLRRAADYIGAHAGEPMTIATVAEAIGLSAGYLSRVFRGETGETFSSFITHVRLRRSLELLAAPRLRPLIEIALECGFPNSKAFNLAFKRSFACTPSEWRSARRARVVVPDGQRYQSIDEARAVHLLYAYIGDTPAA